MTDAKALQDKLLAAGMATIFIADDTPENVKAAQKAAEYLPRIKFHFFNNGKEMIGLIPTQHKEIGLIITDLQMETDDVGLKVVEVGWNHLVPVFVLTGGFQHANQPQVRIAPCFGQGALPDGIKKSSPEAWILAMEIIAGQITAISSLLSALLLARKAGIPLPEDGFYGEQARKVVKGYLEQT